MKGNWLAILAGVALLLGSTTANAWMLRCDGCNESQRIETARDFGLYQQPFFEGIVHVADFPGNALYALDLRCTRRGGINPFGGTEANGSRTTPPPASMASSDPCIQFSVSPATVDAAYQTAFEGLRGFWAETQGSMVKRVTIPVTMIGEPGSGIHGFSAYDVVGSANVRHMIARGIERNCAACGIGATPGGIISGVLAFLGVAPEAVSIVTIVFADGTRATFENRASFGDGRFEYVENSAETAGGQRIPGNLTEPDAWYFGSGWNDPVGETYRMADHLGNLASVVWQTRMQATGYWIISCGRVGNGHR